MSVIRASEIGEYVYCHRAWWLRRVQGLEPANWQALADGTAAHARHGRQVLAALILRALALAAVVLAVLVWLLSSGAAR